MASGPNITSAAGLRRIQFYKLDTTGYPDDDQSGADGYDGVELEGSRSLNLNIPDVRTVQHVGSDRLIAQDYLPPTEGAGAEVTTAKQNLGADATLTDTGTSTVGETTMGAMLTDKQGTEIDVAVVGYRQALDTTKGSGTVRRWQMHMFPIGRMIPRGSGAAEGGADENAYSLVASVATAPPWGHTFSEADENYEEAQYLRFTAENPAMLERWTGNGTLDTFNLSWTPISVAKTAVFVDGTLATVSSVDTDNDTVTLDSAPANATKVVAWYETSDDI